MKRRRKHQQKGGEQYLETISVFAVLRTKEYDMHAPVVDLIK